jgi:hypothetical protein
VTPGWLTVTLLPPAVIVALRALVLLLAAAVKEIVPFPLPEPLTVSQDVALLLDVHAQPDGAVMLKVPLPPAVGALADDGDTL